MIIDNDEGLVFRPPGEADSLIIRATIGCSHNACTFCIMYKDVKFRIRSLDELTEIIKVAAISLPMTRRVFIADGNALVLSTEKLLKLLAILKNYFPKLSRVTCYGGPKDILRKTVTELTILREAGLRTIYLGIESGDNEVLSEVKKGVTSEEMVEAGRKVLTSGIKLSAMIILGLGGKKHSAKHALNTARVVSAINPTMLSTLTLTLYEGTPLWKASQNGTFSPLSDLETLHELKQIMENINLTRPCIFRSNHISNLVPLAGTLNKDKEILISEINEVIEFLNKHLI